jgi:hypothetical protein
MSKDFFICPNVQEYWAGDLANWNATTIDCSKKPYKYFDQIITEEYERGCQFFVCKIGAGYDMAKTIPEIALEQLEVFVSTPESCDDMRGKYCSIGFGSREGQKYVESGCTRISKYYDYRYNFDDKFIDDFSTWWNNPLNADIVNNIMIFFIDMTAGFINDKVTKFITNFHTTKRPIVMRITYTSSNVRENTYLVTSSNKIEEITSYMVPVVIFIRTKMKGGNYKMKYIKYKTKYLELKKLYIQ